MTEHENEIVLKVDNLTVTHKVRRKGGRRVAFDAVKNVSLEVQPGEIVGLVGESGSGKTSLALAVCALGKISSGNIRVCGFDLTSLRGRELRDVRGNVQMVFQDPHSSLDPRQRIGDGFRELRRQHPERVGGILDIELLDKVNLERSILERLPSQISGGQAQRVSIIRAIMLQPSLIVADEPTSGLDATVQAQIIDLFGAFRKERGLSILFVSHNLAVVREFCDRAYVMKEGAIVESGSSTDLFCSPQHPYTKLLVSSVPGKSADLASI